MLLLRILATHPDVKAIIPVSSSKAGGKVLDADPGLSPVILEKLEKTDGCLVTVQEAAALKPDVVFAALPHLASAAILEPFFGRCVVIDLSADFRIPDPAMFAKAYGQAPPRPDLLGKAVYGLAEIYTEDIKKADLIANPGCYPTASLLPLFPLLKCGMIQGDLIINALSGISGAGKKAAENLLFCERTENAGAYSPGRTHRHTIEIQKEADLAFAAAGKPGSGGAEVFFTPHLIPVKRGMSVTTTVNLASGITGTDVRACLEAAYAGRVFVRIEPARIPQTRDVWDTNRCDIGFHTESGPGNKSRLFLFSVIDNLVKGASGQAVQNMNIRFGLPEATGLSLHGAL